MASFSSLKTPSLTVTKADGNDLESRSRSVEGSPSSSVFDLPHHSEEVPVVEVEKKRHVFPFPPPPSSGLTLLSNATVTEAKPIATHLENDPTYLVLSGGTGCNSIVSAFGDTCYVLPVSDDGGSSSEIIRVLGGPSIGDIRSRLVRLIPTTSDGSPLERIRHLLAYRLPSDVTEREARDEWRDIIEGKSVLWSGIPHDRKEVIRGFLVHFEAEVLRRAQKNFSFRNGSVGNYFLAAARIFFRSLPAAIFLFSSITNSQANIIPVLVTNHTVTISVELENGRSIVGQCNISHPVQSESTFFLGATTPDLDEDEGDGRIRTSSTHNLDFTKASEDIEKPLESRIQRLFYINAHGHEIYPTPNPDFLAYCDTRDALVYSCGSLWTSIMPCLALKGVASAIARSRSLKAKIFLLNAKNDRETGGYTATHYIKAIARTLNVHYEQQDPYTSYPISAFITHLVFLRGGSIPLDVQEITSLGVQCVEVVPSSQLSEGKGPEFDAESVQEVLHKILKQG